MLNNISSDQGKDAKRKMLDITNLSCCMQDACHIWALSKWFQMASLHTSLSIAQWSELPTGARRSWIRFPSGTHLPYFSLPAD